MRLFIALPVPQAVKAELRRAQAELSERIGSDAVRWTNPGQIHLTLRFLGQVAEERVDELKHALEFACHRLGPLRLHAERIGFFPSERRPRVIWASVTANERELEILQSAVSSAASALTNEPEEKHFAAHLTIGRAKELGRREAQALALAAQQMTGGGFGNWTADRVEIIRSELGPQGSRHVCLLEIPLRG
jgi:2'-5' RNA ligase